MTHCKTCKVQVSLETQRETVHSKTGDYCSVKCFINDPETLSSMECRSLGCVPTFISRCVCGGVVERIEHHAHLHLTGRESLSHVAAHISYSKGCIGPSHQFVEAAA